jgi:hypothetical protein
LNKKGFIETELVKETNIHINEAEETCEAPKQKEIATLEVKPRQKDILNSILIQLKPILLLID